METPPNIASFVLRFTQDLWEDDQHEPHIRWRGQIRHVQGQAEDRFTDFAEAVTFIQKSLTQLTIDSLSGKTMMTQDKILKENFKLWEQFAASYTSMMFQAMEQSIKQSEIIREQVAEAQEKAMQVWQASPPHEQASLADTLTQIQQDLQALHQRMDALEARLDADKPSS